MKTILVVDDEPILRMLVSTTMADTEYRVMEASNGESARRLVATEKPDLILLDWTMPGMTGLDLATALRADPATRHIAIVMLTAKGQERDRARAANLGVTGYLVKPFSPLELMDRVRSVLG
jgi:two-component system phosphate regulon response regulator PhoB